jgi:hypothetical protein
MNFEAKVFKYTSIKQVSSKSSNPFLESISTKTKTDLKRLKTSDIISDRDLDTNTAKDIIDKNKELGKIEMGIGKLRRKQTSNFVILYYDKEVDFYNLSGTTLRVLFYIMYKKLAIGVDFIVLDSKDLMENLNINRNSAYESILDLLNAGIIDKRNDYNWWINPEYFYRGNRMFVTTK